MNNATSKPSRRRFLVNCSALAAAAAVAPSALARPLRNREMSLEQISAEDFARQLNSTFVVHTEQGSRRLVLAEIQSPAVSPNAEDAQNEKFTLRFRGVPALPLGQDTYWFEHQRIGLFAMFIVPIGCMDERYCCYEAVFNRPPTRRGHNWQSRFR